jgi:VPDSG-CTERM motif
MKTQLTIILFCALTSLGKATDIQIGQVTFGGDFTLNHFYDWNYPSSQPFGTFGVMTATSASGMFQSYVQVGSTLDMSSPNFSTESLNMVWQTGGFTLVTTSDLVTGADFFGQYCVGDVNLTGHGFDPSIYGTGAIVEWNFTAPPYYNYDFHQDITGPITLTIVASYNDGLPDSGTTIILLGFALLVLASFQAYDMARI